MLAILVVFKNGLPAITTIHDVIHGAGILDAQLARHKHGQAAAGGLVMSSGFRLTARGQGGVQAGSLLHEARIRKV